MADQKSRYERFKDAPRVTLGARVIDLSQSGPLTLKDKRDLRIKHGIVIGGETLSPEQEEKLVWYCLQRLCPDLAESEIDGLPLGTAEDIVTYVSEKGREIQYPFSLPSTSLPPPTGGDGQR